MNLDLTNKNAIVCGSTDGIGKACAIELATLGATITLVARNEEKLKQTRDELSTSAGQTHSYLTIDFQQPDYLKAVLQEYATNQSEIHILINNTGGPPAGPAHEASLDAFRKGFEMHVIGNQILVQALLPKMKNTGYGRIINIVSTSVKEPIPGLGVSNTIRGAVGNWAKTLSKELGQYGITVNNILPGSTETGRIHDLIKNRAANQGTTPEEVERSMKEQIPVGRFAEPAEIGYAVAFLASPAAAYISGVNLTVDGGKMSCA
ncbi:SDR family oxidoreductase [Tunicatimonas pelagia]|uniref:SDR family oxidoreductase n=1 Tax=Tunicatimonas pelagia TaxID=931531 RepID=UPI002665A672|nr:SDR family oxidoreductase [Tunicatimonas pelagia]WKN44594.1 SDR family oxidoreductase [Tunicatimonas pelagia]